MVCEIFSKIVCERLEIDCELLICESVSRELVINGKVTKYMRAKATELLRKKKLKNIGGGSFTSDDELINTIPKTCTCYYFLDKAACKHLTAACIEFDIELPGSKPRSQCLRTIRRKKLIMPNESQENDQISYSPLCSPISQAIDTTEEQTQSTQLNNQNEINSHEE